MKLTFLGTGAADWTLAEHRELCGFRRNSSLLIDDCLLIDPGPCVADALDAFGKNKDDIKYIINTHRHPDHYDENTVSLLGAEKLVKIEAGEAKQIGKYTVQAVRANHSTPTVHFLIFDGEKRVFYGLDGGWLMYEEIEAIRESGVDLLLLDGTVGDIDGDYRIFEHNNLDMVRQMKASLGGYARRVMITHIAKTLHTSHIELCVNMEKSGIEVAYDGLETEA